MQQDRMEIYCPRCSWRPAPEDRWSCDPPCGTRWHTFWTRGLCPGCAKQWKETQCLACHEFSLHRLWYHVPASGKKTKTRKEEIKTAG
jgi:hypothetical protein